MADVFFSYSHKDQDLRDRLEEHLASLKREGLIETWHDRKITPGDLIDPAIDAAMERADVILLLISSAFIASDYCHDIEMTRALERHEQKSARVIPIILRPCDWHSTRFGKLLALPTDGKAVALWHDTDQAFLEVALGIRQVLRDLQSNKPRPQPKASPVAAASSIVPRELARSSNLRVTKRFTEHDKHSFLRAAFDHMATFFEGSALELTSREPTVTVEFRKIDADRFVAAAYRHGNLESRCSVTIVTGGHFGAGIQYSADGSGHGFNESLQVGADDYTLYLRSLGMFAMSNQRADEKLTHNGAADLFWGRFMEPLQRSGR